MNETENGEVEKVKIKVLFGHVMEGKCNLKLLIFPNYIVKLVV